MRVAIEKFRLKKSVAAVLAAGMLGTAVPPAFGAAEFKLSDDAGVTAGIGLRTSFQVTDSATPTGSNSKDFVIDNARLFFSGHYGKIIKGTLNTDYDSVSDNLRILDAYVGFEFNDAFNIWFGRFLPPQDRANGYGPFYALPWSYPGAGVSNYPMIENGRDNGVAFWGKLAGGKFVYGVGAFEGHNKYSGSAGIPGFIPPTAAAASDKLAYQGRIQYHFWEVAPGPGYLMDGWYGGKNLMSVGLAAYTQQDGVGSLAAPGRLRIWNIDALFETKTAAGVPTLEGAYYQYKLGAVDCGSGEPGAPLCAPNLDPSANNNFAQVDGKAWLLGAAWLFPQKVGWGSFQPYYRYQKYERSVSSTDVTQQDFGLNYIIKGPNAKISAQYSKMEDSRPVPGTDSWRFLLGVQLIY